MSLFGWTMMEVRRIGCALLVDPTRRFLLQQREDIPTILQPGKIGLFGGHCEPDETNLDCAFREIAEETGIAYSHERFELLRMYEGKDFEIGTGQLQATVFLIRDVDSELLRITEGSLYIADIERVQSLRPYLTPVAIMAFAAYFARNLA